MNMTYVKQFALIALLTFIGECLNLLIPLPVPASIYGMVLLFLCLQTGILKLSQIEEKRVMSGMSWDFPSKSWQLLENFSADKDK